MTYLQFITIVTRARNSASQLIAPADVFRILNAMDSSHFFQVYLKEFPHPGFEELWEKSLRNANSSDVPYTKNSYLFSSQRLKVSIWLSTQKQINHVTARDREEAYNTLCLWIERSNKLDHPEKKILDQYLRKSFLYLKREDQTIIHLMQAVYWIHKNDQEEVKNKLIYALQATILSSSIRDDSSNSCKDDNSYNYNEEHENIFDKNLLDLLQPYKNRSNFFDGLSQALDKISLSYRDSLALLEREYIIKGMRCFADEHKQPTPLLLALYVKALAISASPENTLLTMEDLSGIDSEHIELVLRYLTDYQATDNFLDILESSLKSRRGCMPWGQAQRELAVISAELLDLGARTMAPDQHHLIMKIHLNINIPLYMRNLEYRIYLLQFSDRKLSQYASLISMHDFQDTVKNLVRQDYTQTLKALFQQDNSNFFRDYWYSFAVEAIRHARCAKTLNFILVDMRQDADIGYESNYLGETLLYLACVSGSIELVSALLENGISINKAIKNYCQNVCSKQSYVPLFIAVGARHQPLVEFLLAHDADIDWVDDVGINILAYALEQGYVEIIPIIIDAIKERFPECSSNFNDKVIALLNNEGCYNKACAHAMILKKDNLVIADLLLSEGLFFQCDPLKRSGIFLDALCIGSEDWAIWFIEKDLMIFLTNDKELSLRIALDNQCLKVGRILLEKGISQEQKNLLFHRYGGHHNVDRIALLAEYGASMHRNDYLILSPSLYDNPFVAAVYKNSLDNIEFLEKNQWDISAECSAHPELVSIAAKNESAEMIRWLAKNGWSVHYRDCFRRSPMHVICSMPHPSKDCVEALLELGVPVNIQDVMQRTPMHYAVMSYDIALIHLLIAHGANLDIVDADRISVWDQVWRFAPSTEVLLLFHSFHPIWKSQAAAVYRMITSISCLNIGAAGEFFSIGDYIRDKVNNLEIEAYRALVENNLAKLRGYPSIFLDRVKLKFQYTRSDHLDDTDCSTALVEAISIPVGLYCSYKMTERNAAIVGKEKIYDKSVVNDSKDSLRKRLISKSI